MSSRPNTAALSRRWLRGYRPRAGHGGDGGGGNFSGGFELRFVSPLEQHVAMAELGRAPADQMLTANLGQRCQQVGMQQHPSAIHRDYLGAISIVRRLERICPLAFAPAVPRRPADIDLMRLRLVRLPTR